jgi:hypothetical protein
MEAAGQSREAMVPVFLDYIGKLQTAKIDDLERMDAFVFIFFLLAEWRETRAYHPLAKLLRRDPEFLDALLGDSITEASARVMAGVFDGDLQPLFDILLDDGRTKFKYHLNRSYYGLYIPPMIWREIDNFSSGSVCMVLASEHYSEDDYYRDYDQFSLAANGK